MLSDGMSGINWAGFELAVARFGVDDAEDLIDRLVTIKCHQPDKDDQPSEPDDGV